MALQWQLADNTGGLAVDPHQRVQFAGHACARDAGIGDQAQVLAAAIVDHGEDPKPARGAETV